MATGRRSTAKSVRFEFSELEVHIMNYPKFLDGRAATLGKRSIGRSVFTATLLILALVGAVAWAQPEQQVPNLATQQQGSLDAPTNLGATAKPGRSWQLPSEAELECRLKLEWAPRLRRQRGRTRVCQSAARILMPAPLKLRCLYREGRPMNLKLAPLSAMSYTSPNGIGQGDTVFSVGVQEIITTLPLTLRNDLEVVYVVDTSGSMRG